MATVDTKKTEAPQDSDDNGGLKEGSILNVELGPPHETKRGLSSRHSQMIALGGTIGTGLFVGSGQALGMGGPLFFLLSYMIISVLLVGVVTASTEFSAYLPVPGATVAYFGNRFFSRSMGFALGWMYWYICVITVPAEITAASLVISYWNPPVSVAVWIAIILVVIVIMNFLPVKFYGESEFWFASIKIIGIFGLLIMALVLACGGGPAKHQEKGFTYWHDPGTFRPYLTTGSSGYLCSFVSTVCYSVFAFVFAPELLVITGGEMQNPRRNLPLAGRRYIIRLVLFYVLSAFFLGMIVRSDDPNLLSSTGHGAAASPWAIAAKRHGIRGLDSVINAVILLSAWSAGNAWLYMASRSLYSMAAFGTAPAIFGRCTPSGVPYMAVAASALFALLAFMNVSSSAATVFNWFVNLINCSGFVSWICMGAIYLRFRAAVDSQGITVAGGTLPYRSKLQPYASYVSMACFTLLLLVSGYSTFLNGHWSTSGFVTSYFGIPLFLVLFLGHKVMADRSAPWFIPSSEVDLHTGLEEVLETEEPASDKGYKWYMKWRLIWE